VIAVAFALAAAVSWGVSDYLGGRTTENLAVSRVLAVSQAFGLALIVAVLLAQGGAVPTGRHAVEAAAAGIAAVVALAFLYVALARGSAVIVAPVAASGAVVPVAVGIISGDPLTTVSVLAIAVTLAGIVCASWADESGRSRQALIPALLAVGAAGCTGLYLTLIDLASEGENALGVVTTMRSAATVLATCAVVAISLWRRGAGVLDAEDAEAGKDPDTGKDAADPRPARPAAAAMPSIRRRGAWSRAQVIAVTGVGGVGASDAVAEVCFGRASQQGLLSVVAVLANLYPVVTIVLALVFSRERFGRLQGLGAATTVVGVALLVSQSA
jgi:drug/metabolite transporter (DMT)-like permease